MTTPQPHFTVEFIGDVNRKKVNKRIRFEGKSIEEKLENMLSQTKDVLGMRPRKMEIRVKVYRSWERFTTSYQGLFGDWGIRMDEPSYYIHKYTTIYLWERAISKRRLLHEIAHAVTDYHFAINPMPEKLRELLPQYVETKLAGRRFRFRLRRR